MKIFTANVMKWAVHPADQGRITYIDGMKDGHTLPAEGDVITRPFLVDPATKQPIPVRVVELRQLNYQGVDVIAILVTRDQ